MAERYYDKMNIQENKDAFMKSIVNYMKQFSFTFVSKDESEINVDEVISKKIILHLEDFFNHHNKKRTRRNRHKKNKTRKKQFNLMILRSNYIKTKVKQIKF